MKLSEAMRKGYAKVGRQCFGQMFTREAGDHRVVFRADEVHACCASGAIKLGDTQAWVLMMSKDVEKYIVRLNDQCRMPIPQIAEVLESMGL